MKRGHVRVNENAKHNRQNFWLTKAIIEDSHNVHFELVEEQTPLTEIIRQYFPVDFKEISYPDFGNCT